MAKTKPTKVVKKAEKKPVVKKGYTLEVSVNDVEYKGKGETMVEALANFVASKDFPFSVKTRVMFKFSDGKKEGVQRYNAIMANRMFKVMSKKLSALEIVARKMEERMN